MNTNVEKHAYFLSELKRSNIAGDYYRGLNIAYNSLEDRTQRMLCKVPEFQNYKICTCRKSVGVSKKIKIIERLIKKKHTLFIGLDLQLISDLGTWKDQRNKIIHGIYQNEDYKNSDKAVKELSIQGELFIKKLYKMANIVRLRAKTLDRDSIDPLDKSTLFLGLSKDEKLDFMK